MSLTELRPAIHLLPRPEKLLLVQELLEELDQQDELARLGIFPHKEYPIWSPTENYDVAAVLQEVLEADKKSRSCYTDVSRAKHHSGGNVGQRGSDQCTSPFGRAGTWAGVGRLASASDPLRQPILRSGQRGRPCGNGRPLSTCSACLCLGTDGSGSTSSGTDEFLQGVQCLLLPLPVGF